jgi:hypothetical protein
LSVEVNIGGAPLKFGLAQNYPNPFNPSTTIRFRLPARQRISIKSTNTAGRDVAEIADGEFPAGENAILWNAAGMPSGCYVYTLNSSAKSISMLLVLLK